ncbi:hypothetical protein SAMN05216368_11312 [Cryobacterium flavum]|uniref:Uncharacterized protein n=1 Tax=Cryobacterium flavum TaxID=1424659 RepID=A0A5E9G217_9MICO|nr:hypothetical protein SAMN05216368_11312 [Cryobacterium flavum]
MKASFSFQVATLIDRSEGDGVAATWFQGMNPQLGDQSSARVLHKDRTDEAIVRVLGAAKGLVCDAPSVADTARKLLYS